MRYVDEDGDAATFGSSSATLALPVGATCAVRQPLLGRRRQPERQDCVTGVAADAPPRNRALLKPPAGTTYLAVTAGRVDQAEAPFQGIYSSVADGTNVVRARRCAGRSPRSPTGGARSRCGQSQRGPDARPTSRS
jgi:hypothetical protein